MLVYVLKIAARIVVFPWHPLPTQDLTCTDLYLGKLRTNNSQTTQNLLRTKYKWLSSLSQSDTC
jgi:hypothetical protein